MDVNIYSHPKLLPSHIREGYSVLGIVFIGTYDMSATCHAEEVPYLGY